MTTVSKIAKNSIVSFLSDVINKILTLFVTIVIARYLGDSGFGRYSFIITMMALFQVLADFGLDGLTIREIAKRPDKADVFIRNVLTLKLILGAINAVILFVVIGVMNKPADVVYGVYVSGLIVIFFCLANTFNSAFNAYERLDLKAGLMVSTRFIVLALTIIAIMLKQGIIVLITIILLSEIIRTVSGWMIYESRFSRIRLGFDPEICKGLLKMALPFALIGLIVLVYFKIDIVMLSLMKDDQVVGWYSAAYMLLSGLFFITDAYNLAIFPPLSRYALSSRDLLAFSWARSVKYLLIISLPIAFGTTILADKIILLVYSTSYYPSVSALQILIWTLPWIFVNSINLRVLYATNKQKEAMVVAVASMLLNVAFNFILIPPLSFIGSSLATLIVEIINVSVYFWLIFKLLGLKVETFKILPKPLIASGAMTAMLLALNTLNIFILMPLGMIIYLGMLIILKTFDTEDINILKKALSLNKSDKEYRLNE